MVMKKWNIVFHKLFTKVLWVTNCSSMASCEKNKTFSECKAYRNH